MSPGKWTQTQMPCRYFKKKRLAIVRLANGYSSRQSFLIKDHLQGIRVGIKNWPGCVSRYKH